MAISARPPRHLLGPGALGLGEVWSRSAARFPRRLMAWLLQRARGRALPAPLRAQLAYARGERALMVSRDQDGGCALIATDRALHHRTGRDDWSHLGWEQIADVSWAPGRLVITGLAGAEPRTIVPLHRRGTWPELAEERITHTRLNRQPVMIDGHQRVVVEVRRRPATGELRWVLASSRDLDPGDQDLRRQIERAVTQLCGDLGIAIPSGADQQYLCSLAGPDVQKPGP
jgi:hypothetical protein